MGPSSGTPLPRSFYDRATRRVARDLLGKILVHDPGDGARSVRIVEVEAYLSKDPASHAFHGPTPRNASMFARPGTLYVFRIHQVVCADVTTRVGEAVLLRAGSPIPPFDGNPSGPGRLCRHLGVTLDDDGVDLLTSATRILGAPRPLERVDTAPRVGISRAKEARLRFFLSGDRWVSAPRPWGRVGRVT
ncbi:MAG: DNA-3-methyladenine glycosylase [Thermoplasmata archaeon]|nr:DNA-3-methyladenine glycosylase [Thermoplasmata archaeon]